MKTLNSLLILPLIVSPVVYSEESQTILFYKSQLEIPMDTVKDIPFNHHGRNQVSCSDHLASSVNSSSQETDQASNKITPVEHHPFTNPYHLTSWFYLSKEGPELLTVEVSMMPSRYGSHDDIANNINQPPAIIPPYRYTITDNNDNHHPKRYSGPIHGYTIAWRHPEPVMVVTYYGTITDSNSGTPNEITYLRSVDHKNKPNVELHPITISNNPDVDSFKSLCTSSVEAA